MTDINETIRQAVAIIRDPAFEGHPAAEELKANLYEFARLTVGRKSRLPWPKAVVLVCGTREATFEDFEVVRRRLAAIYKKFDGEVIFVHGHCPDGVDAFVDDWCVSMGMVPKRFPFIKGVGGIGGPIRNQDMAVYLVGWKALGVVPVWCEAFPSKNHASRGTRGCVEICERLGIQVVKTELEVECG